MFDDVGKKSELPDESEISALSEQLIMSYEELSLIYKLSEQLQNRKEFDELFSECASDLQELINFDSLILFVQASSKQSPIILTSGRVSMSQEVARITGMYLLSRHREQFQNSPILLTDLSGHPELVSIFRTVNVNLLAWPIVINDRKAGTLAVLKQSVSEQFDSSDTKMIATIARHMSWFLENRMLIDDLEELLMGLLSSLVNVIDAKDPYTRGHSQRVALIAMRIAQTLKFSQDECDRIYLAGLLHDIGKIGINDSILGKPGKLTSEEFRTMQSHTILGARIISSLKQFKPIIPGILYHHERYDGNGYPEGLSGKEIPAMGMIVGLADCFDAITSDRTYHKAMSISQALEEIRININRSFDPEIVSGLLDCDIEKLNDEMASTADSHILIPLTSLFVKS